MVSIFDPLNMLRTCFECAIGHSFGKSFLLITLQVAPLSTWKRTGWPLISIVAKIFDLMGWLLTLLTLCSSRFWDEIVKQYSSSLESCEVFASRTRWIRSFLRCRPPSFCLHSLAKWFVLPHFAHSFPNAGHLSLDLSCFLPQYLQLTNLGLASLPSFFSLWLSALTSSLPLMTFICDAVVSADRHTSIHFWRFNLGSCSNFFLVPVSQIPQTILSRINSSVSGPKMHVFARVLSAVRYVSNDSPLSCFLLLKQYRS